MAPTAVTVVLLSGIIQAWAGRCFNPLPTAHLIFSVAVASVSKLSSSKTPLWIFVRTFGNHRKNRKRGVQAADEIWRRINWVIMTQEPRTEFMLQCWFTASWATSPQLPPTQRLSSLSHTNYFQLLIIQKSRALRQHPVCTVKQAHLRHAAHPAHSAKNRELSGCMCNKT